MQPDRATNKGGRTMEVVAATLRCQLLLIMLMAAMLLPGMKVSLLLVQRKITRTIELQESIGKVRNVQATSSNKPEAGLDYCGNECDDGMTLNCRSLTC
ncbi:hypothetical protein STEG23_000047 [Scotinomys teguina]